MAVKGIVWDEVYSLSVIAPDGRCINTDSPVDFKYAGLADVNGKWRLFASGASEDAVLNRLLEAAPKRATKYAVRSYVRVQVYRNHIRV